LIRIGSAGWSYPDWEGVVYPPRTRHRFDPLAYLAGFMDCIEINSTFYRIPEASAVAHWAARVSESPSFLFTVKLWRGFTHGPPLPPGDIRAAENAFKTNLAPLRDAGRLGALLIQCPYSFHNTARNRTRLREIMDRFEGMPLAVEVRHDSWLVDEFTGMLRERGAAFCNIDQPSVSRNIQPTAHVTAGFAYVRLHGRNAESWFEDGVGRDRRYDYLYSEAELSIWKDLVSGMSGATDIFIIANNHYRGKAVANVVEMRSIVEDRMVPAPRQLIAAYPRLARRATPAPAARGEMETHQGELPFS